MLPFCEVILKIKNLKNLHKKFLKIKRENDQTPSTDYIESIEEETIRPSTYRKKERNNRAASLRLDF